MKLTQTATQVHSPSSQLHQRWEAYVSDQYKLSALSLLAQLWLSHSLFLTDRVSTPSYLSMLLILAPASALYLWTLLLSRQVKKDTGILTALLPRMLGRGLEWLIALSLLTDAVFLLCGVSSLLGDILPTLRHYLIAPLIALFAASSLMRNQPFALIRLAGFLFFPLLAGITLSSASALQEGSAAHFFPLLGKGASSICMGTVWLCGNLGSICLPLLMPGEEAALRRMRQKGKRRGMLALLACMLFSALISAMYTYLLSPYALSDAASVGMRLLMPVQISSSIPGWSLYVCALILLLLIAYSGSVSRCAAFFSGHCTKEKHAPDWLIAIVILFTVPCAVFYSHRLQNLLIDLLPYRIIPYLISLLFTSAGAAFQWIKARKQA